MEVVPRLCDEVIPAQEGADQELQQGAQDSASRPEEETAATNGGDQATLMETDGGFNTTRMDGYKLLYALNWADQVELEMGDGGARGIKGRLEEDPNHTPD
ncbi:hypothetical protein R1sor_002176 [Riccia sorocarpa]|uniref:Uncharacterized protein n=1 Tax=Riccia sorocarpa TaxID=122646 RepID=A0ABD3H411_9MARC